MVCFLILISGSSYNGEWNKGVREGQGTYIWPNGDSYQGGWARDAPNGLGTYRFKDSTVRLQGTFEDGRITQGRMTFDGGFWEGGFRLS